MKTRMFLTFAMMVISFNALAINLQNFHFSNSPVYATQEDALLSEGFITTDYKYILDMSYNYVRAPFIEIDNGSRSQTIVEWMHTLNLGGAYRFSDSFQVGFSTFATYEKALGVGEDDYDTKYVLGDSTIDFKYKFYEKNKLAISFTPKIYLPTGDSDYYTSNENVGFYFGGAVEKAFSFMQMVLNFGHMENSKAQYDIIDYRRQFHLSAGLLFPLFGPLDLTAEFFRDYPYDSGNPQSPSELNVGLRFANADDSAFFAGMGTGSLEESNSTDLRTYVGYKYYPSAKVKSAKVKDEEKRFGKFYKLFNIYFKTGSYKLSVEEAKKLDKMTRQFSQDKYLSKIVLEGYTSKIGSAKLNRSLSLKRTKAVREYLQDKGIKINLVETVAYGNKFSDANVLNKSEDRKVMFRVYRER